MNEYKINWRIMPLGAVKNYGAGWYSPCLGQGVYMYVLHTTKKEYAIFYVGKSVDLGDRWWQRFHKKDEWFLDDTGFWVPQSAEQFLEDPIGVINRGKGEGGFAQYLPNRKEILAKILGAAHFAYAEIDELEAGDTLEHIEYVLQEGVKKHKNIGENGWIGDNDSRAKPVADIRLRNICLQIPEPTHSIERVKKILGDALPEIIEYNMPPER